LVGGSKNYNKDTFSVIDLGEQCSDLACGRAGKLAASFLNLRVLLREFEDDTEINCILLQYASRTTCKFSKTEVVTFDCREEPNSSSNAQCCGSTLMCVQMLQAKAWENC
jgi:hypothetical protein